MYYLQGLGLGLGLGITQVVTPASHVCMWARTNFEL